ncbi:FtsB family cell division protein [Galactobacter caseinivorans]|uniref:FtsB family cell division protein n=1 Tax=Galactobacter caseinivorans TaxID=2676123 RepID=UPI0013149C6B|nr:septum formation initiator family protein [Galactobacter caseinivorans]
MANRPPRVPHTGKAQDAAARNAARERAAQAQAERLAAEQAGAEQIGMGQAGSEPDLPDAAARVFPDGAGPAVPTSERLARGREEAEDADTTGQRAAEAARRARAAATRTARKGAQSFGQGVQRARKAVAEEIEADLAGENLPGGARRRKNQDPAKQQRRLIERVALEGAIREAGEAPRVVERVPAPRATAPTPARSLSTRVIALTVILIVSGFMLFPAVTTYVRQQTELRAAQADIAEQQAAQDRLQDELKRWEDPEYVQQQARDRIGQALPGEKQYVVKGEPPRSDEEQAAAVKPGEYRQGLPWGDGLWDSVVRSSTP